MAHLSVAWAGTLRFQVRSVGQSTVQMQMARGSPLSLLRATHLASRTPFVEPCETFHEGPVKKTPGGALSSGKKTPGGAGAHTGHTGAHRHTDHIENTSRPVRTVYALRLSPTCCTSRYYKYAPITFGGAWGFTHVSLCSVGGCTGPSAQGGACVCACPACPLSAPGARVACTTDLDDRSLHVGRCTLVRSPNTSNTFAYDTCCRSSLQSSTCSRLEGTCSAACLSHTHVNAQSHALTPLADAGACLTSPILHQAGTVNDDAVHAALCRRLHTVSVRVARAPGCAGASATSRSRPKLRATTAASPSTRYSIWCSAQSCCTRGTSCA